MSQHPRVPMTSRITMPRLSGLGLVALLTACGTQPQASNDMVEPENAANAVINAAENALVNAAEPANVTNATVSPTPSPAPTPTATATPVVAATPQPTPVVATADAANGQKLFAQCKICHAVEPDKNGLGPSLHGVVGRKAAALASFNYSPAMKASGLTWTDSELDDYLRAPMKTVPGTKMAFAGIANDKNRADVIAYLDTLK